MIHMHKPVTLINPSFWDMKTWPDNVSTMKAQAKAIGVTPRGV